MSGDVQPRKRKDKKKKRDDEDIKESHHGVHLTKMGSDDVHLHVQSDHGTGGHWCAKIFFFSLLAILFGLVGLIILENRGLSDLDTPLSESRFSEYFDGWVDEHRGHDDHHETKTGLEDHDQDAGPFEEEEDHSEQEEDESHDAGFHDDDEHDEEGAGTTEEDDADEEEEANKAEDDDNDNENDDTEEIDQDDDDNETGGDNDEEDDENINQDAPSRDKREVQDEDQDEANDEGFEDDYNTNLEEEETPKDDETDDDDVEDIANENKEAEEESTTQKADDDDAPFDESHTNSDSNIIQNLKNSNENSEPVTKGSSKNPITSGKREGSIEGDTGKLITADANKATTTSEGPAQKTKEDDDDFENESLEEVVDNDAGELLHLRQKAEQEELAARAAEAQEVEESDSAPLAVKIVVGLALALVARLVLVKKSKPTNADEPARGSPEMKRRFTMISAEDNVPVESEELVDEELDEEEYLEEEEEEDEQLQYSEDEDEEEGASVTKFMPETFEQLNAMYRPKPVEPVVQELPDRKIPEVLPEVPESIPSVPQVKEETRRIVFDDTPQVNLVEPLNNDEYDIEPDDYDDEVRFEHDADEEVSDEDDAEIYSGSEEDVDDEEISDVDDDELMKRLEEKYGKLPAKQYGSEEDDDEEPTWTKIRPNDRGPQSYTDEDEYIDEEIRRANEDLFNDNLKSALQIYESLVLQYPDHPGALYGKAKVLDRLADKYKSNHVLNEAIESYRALLSLDKKIEDEIFRDAAERCLDRMRFKGMHIQSVPIYRKLIKRFSNEPKIRNQLAVTYLLLNRLPEAKYILHRTLMRWRDDGFAQAHYGFILKIHDNDLKGAVALLREGIASGANGTQDGRFYFNLGDALYRLGDKKEAMEVYRKGAELNLFPSEYQRSLYNVPELKAQPFWTKEETTYGKELNILERNWALIRNEAMAALSSKGYFIDEAESLKDTGDWKQLELFARGSKIGKNCVKTPLTCKIIETFPAARSCKRGQVKFSVMHPGTHVWAHCGPTNCRLRAHLGLKVPPGTTLRVATEERTWKEGEFLIFDDSFEHEVWHNGTSLRLVLIVDIWHPELTEQQRDTLSPI